MHWHAQHVVAKQLNSRRQTLGVKIAFWHTISGWVLPKSVGHQRAVADSAIFLHEEFSQNDLIARLSL